MKNVLVWDTETTGLPLHPAAALALQPHVIEFGCAILSGKTGKLIETREWLINPGVPLPPIITKITGITSEDLQGKPSFAAAWPAIAATFTECGLAIAHNEPFDHSMIEFELTRLGQTDFIWPKRLCTIGLFRGAFGYDMKLTDLYANVTGRTLDQKHRAAGDVSALVEIVQEGGLWKL